MLLKLLPGEDELVLLIFVAWCKLLFTIFELLFVDDKFVNAELLPDDVVSPSIFGDSEEFEILFEADDKEEGDDVNEDEDDAEL